MRIYLVRHGETTGDIENRYGGDYDDHLTDRGTKESEELAKKLKEKGIKAIYSSPRIRAVETARVVGKLLNVDVTKIDDMRERNHYGVLTGLTKAEALKKYRAAVDELETGLNHQVEGSEDYPSFRDRVVNSFERITSAKKTGCNIDSDARWPNQVHSPGSIEAGRVGLCGGLRDPHNRKGHHWIFPCRNGGCRTGRTAKTRRRGYCTIRFI
jgi:hypothetical protein